MIDKKVYILLAVAITSSLYSITPIFSVLTGTYTISALFAWTQVLRPVFIVVALIVLTVSWYKMLQPAEVPGTCVLNPENVDKISFFKTRLFMLIVTMLSIVIMLFPYWGEYLLPNVEEKNLKIHYSNISKHTVYVENMNCDACKKTIIRYVSDLEGVINTKFTNDEKHLLVKFDNSKNDIDEIVFSISQTGFTAKEIK